MQSAITQQLEPDTAVISQPTAVEVSDFNEPFGTRSPTHAFCITLYNENLDAFRGTLASVVHSASAYRRTMARANEYSTVIVIADGVAQLDASVLAFLECCDLKQEVPTTVIGSTDIHCTMQRSGYLLARMDGQLDPCAGGHDDELQILTCLKQANKGKLHSHAVFLNDLCRILQPTYCYQIDTGTTLQLDAVSVFARAMSEPSNTGAISPRVLPEVPEPGAPFLFAWQFTDLAFRNAIMWPAEGFTGFLSVIPGQMGAFRWRALCSRIQTSDVVTEYLQGLHAVGAIRRTMYLAEDRIIGTQLYCADNSNWCLQYEPNAAVTTDYCQTLAELARQRRRWNNSALACRLWLFGNWPGFLTRKDRNLAQKCTFSSALMIQIVTGLRDFWQPAQLGALVIALSTTVPQGSVIASTIYAAFWVVALLDCILSSIGPRRVPQSALRRGRVAVGWLSAALFTALLVTMPPGAFLILAAPTLALVPLYVIAPRSAFPLLVRTQLSPVPNLLMTIAIQAYSFWHLSDVSWGTKGLSHFETDVVTRRNLRTFRNTFVALWLTSNAALIYLAAVTEGIVEKTLNPVIEAACLAETLFIVLAVLFIVRSKWRRRAKRADAKRPESGCRN